MLSHSDPFVPENFEQRGECTMAGKKKTASKAKKTLKGSKKIGNTKLMGVMIPD